MSEPTVELQGTLRADGTVVLDKQPNVPPGRVKVVLEPLSGREPALQENLYEFVVRTRRELEAKGSRFMNDEEVMAWLDELRADCDRPAKVTHPDSAC